MALNVREGGLLDRLLNVRAKGRLKADTESEIYSLTDSKSLHKDGTKPFLLFKTSNSLIDFSAPLKDSVSDCQDLCL
jgi:hypothetical protein